MSVALNERDLASGSDSVPSQGQHSPVNDHILLSRQDLQALISQDLQTMVVQTVDNAMRMRDSRDNVSVMSDTSARSQASTTRVRFNAPLAHTDEPQHMASFLDTDQVPAFEQNFNAIGRGDVPNQHPVLDFTGENRHPPFPTLSNSQHHFTPMPPVAHSYGSHGNLNFYDSTQVPQRPAVVPVAEHNRRASVEFAGMMPRNYHDFRGPMVHQQSVAQIQPLQEVDKWFSHQNAVLKHLTRPSVDKWLKCANRFKHISPINWLKNGWRSIDARLSDRLYDANHAIIPEIHKSARARASLPVGLNLGLVFVDSSSANPHSQAMIDFRRHNPINVLPEFHRGDSLEALPIEFLEQLIQLSVVPRTMQQYVDALYDTIMSDVNKSPDGKDVCVSKESISLLQMRAEAPNMLSFLAVIRKGFETVNKLQQFGSKYGLTCHSPKFERVLKAHFQSSKGRLFVAQSQGHHERRGCRDECIHL